MAKGPPVDYEDVRRKTLHAAAKLFLEIGYTAATAKKIAAEAGVGVSAMMRAVGSKEQLLCRLVEYVLEGQFAAARQFLHGVTEDKILFYAAETTLQLYMVESAEHIRDLYSVAYSLPESSELIRENIAGKLKLMFGDHLPGLTHQDFYKLEIASGGIIRNFMAVPCGADFTMEEKVRSFLDSTFRIYRVPEEKIEEAIAFVSQFDYPAIAQATIDKMLSKESNQ